MALLGEVVCIAFYISLKNNRIMLWMRRLPIHGLERRGNILQYHPGCPLSSNLTYCPSTNILRRSTLILYASTDVLRQLTIILCRILKDLLMIQILAIWTPWSKWRSYIFSLKVFIHFMMETEEQVE